MNILLCCAAGMSTSLLVTKMEKAAEKQGLEGKIWAAPATQINEHIDKADVVLLGPQVRYLLSKIKALGDEKGIPVDTIDPTHYGMCNGEEVLKTAIKLVSNK
ncbi:PTS sugar transporter subunit IIB [Clostridium sp. YIM B02505]|uniref:PTS sugar transporter subunit IIB n=1 Tax=Clostridium yunnanense TaxID=2800325 RepID=A0ABS1EK35_9CLOT|nr:PTS sugar transporter subunit IIB [Clostridium yunnanense]MBK1809714.1 PTS sugar transporter subunit IIB [Clostridium yunnanense]